MSRLAKSTSGQALLVIILVMAVVLTIALSIVSRTVSDISISKKEDDSSRAFSAAEAGVEQALLKGSGTFTLIDNVTTTDSFRSEATPLASGGTEFAVPTLLSSGETASVWLVEHDVNTGELTCSGPPCFTGSELKVCWGEKDTPDNISTTPALEVLVLYTTSDIDFSTARIARAAYDPWIARPDSNNFTKGYDAGETIAGTSYQFCRTVNLTTSFSPAVTLRLSPNARGGPQLLRLRMLYNTAQAHPAGVKVTSAGTFPLQGQKIVSTGTSREAQRKLEVYQLFSDLPPVFDYTLFSGSGGIVK